MKYNMLVDGGFVSFFYGSRNASSWSTARNQYNNGIILMDSKSIRSDIYPEYKSKRKEKRANDERTQEIYESVSELREYIMNDSCCRVVKVHGAEADDIMALLFMVKPVPCVAIDKDLIQVPGLDGYMMTPNLDAYETGMRKVPQYVSSLQNPKWSPGDFVLFQSVFGDKSDSIPRLLPSHPTRAKEIWTTIKGQKRKIGDQVLKAYETYGEPFLMNLRMVMMPCPSFLDDQELNSIEKLANLIQDETYWSKEHFQGFYQSCLQSVIDRDVSLEENW